MVLAAAVALLSVLAAAYLGPARALETRSIDSRLRLAHSAPPLEDFAIVAIEESTFGVLDTWGPSALDRSAYTSVIRQLDRAGARTIGVDVFFSGTSEPDTDAALATAIAEAGNVAIVAGADAHLAGSGERKRFAPPPDELAHAARTVASPLLHRPDGVVRSVHTTQHDPATGTAWPALSRAVLLDAAKTVPEQFLINWAGPAGSVETIAFEDVHTGQFPADSVRDRFVLIGVTDEMKDLFQTPVGPMSGVEIHTQAAATILSGLYIRHAPAIAGLLVAMLGALGVGLAGRAGRHWYPVFLALIFGAVWFAAANLLFQRSLLLLPVTGPLLAMLLTGVVMAGLQRRSALETLARVWPTWVSEEGEQLEVTVLVCDMAGYTARSERLEPTDLMSMMREFFAIVDDVVGDWGGVSARRPGDAAVVFFRPDPQADHHAARALRAAHDLRDRLDERWPADDIGFGITLTTGEVSLGWVGEAPPEPQILGDPVNVAFRLQSECREKSCPILADWDTATADDEIMAGMRPLGEVEVRNRTEPVQIFTPAQDL